ncbi:glycosyltransferase family 4 protein [Robiginitalea sp. M366]|uniref:glycosyltransferase family 4 protein n=1 Tax=Robiginitalea aestuariiviva TaxID=3036903 RepID=UPI00240E342A|nr:glycosyltransferase family 4 protein [Robiginitalea aestuariiviva]MDG1572727.1 glycosyltransferase family 4 protein [Robiginitalea aestuariiviva]
METPRKLIRITTVPISLGGLLQGQSRFMSQHYEVVGISSPGPGLERVAQQEGIRVIPVTMTRKITPFQDLRALWQLYRIFRRERPYMVHSHTPKAGTLGMFAAWLARVPHRLHTIAGMPLVEARGAKRTLLNAVEWFTYRCATRVYPNSEGLRQIALEHRFASARKLQVLGQGSSNGIDTDFFDPAQVSGEAREALRKSLGLEPGQYVYCYVGRLVRDKGIHELLEAFLRVHADFPETRLLLIGPYENELDPLEPWAYQAIQDTDAILELGWQSDIRPFMALSHSFVFPSYREGFPNVVMQAGAMGLYSIASNINGCNEIIREGENGTLVPPKDADALYTEMKRVLTDPPAGNPATYRQLIGDRYERRFVWDCILQEYRRLERESRN